MRLFQKNKTVTLTLKLNNENIESGEQQLS